MISSYITTDDQEHLSIKYENLYSINGAITYLTTDSTINPPHVTKFMNMYGWRPEIRVFDTEGQIQEYLSTFENKQEIELSVIGDNIWYGNMGHALWDGFYPLYLSLLKFGYKNENFVYLTSDWHNKQIMAYDVITKFSGNNLVEYHQLDKSKLIHFKTLVAGTGAAGTSIVNQDYEMYGRKYDAIRLYKERMYNSYGLQFDKSINDKLKIVIVNNKRYSEQERQILDKIIEFYKNQYNIKFIDWGNDYNQVFGNQLKELEDVDIHISGPGTGIVYMPFLKKGAVNINLGYMEYPQINTIRPNIKVEGYNNDNWCFPGYLEEPMHAAVDYVSTLYYDRYEHNDIEFEPLKNIIEQAIHIINNKELTTNNHFIDAKVFIEYCKRSGKGKELSNYLTGIAFFIDLFVNEHPQTTPSHLVNVELLRQIKDELGYNRKYEYKI
jgi:hypothetical protein